MIFCLIGVTFFVVQNCDFFAGIWAQGGFCVFLAVGLVCAICGGFPGVLVRFVVCVDIKIVKNFFIIFFIKFSDFL